MYELKREKLGGRLKGAILGLLLAGLALLLLPAGANAAAATHFEVSATTPVTAGQAVSFTVTALDGTNATDTGYTGTVHFTSTDGAAVLPANSTLTNGVGMFPATMKTAGSQTITATDTVTASITGVSNSITVNPAAANHFAITAPATATAGTPISFTTRALDPFGNTDTNYAQTVHFSSSDNSATLPANSTLTNGTVTLSATLRRAGSQTITAAQVANLSISGTSASIAVAAAPATHLAVATPPAAQTGTAFDFTVTALDDFGNTDTLYGGTVHLTSTDGAATLPANSTLTMGSRSFTATLRTEGSQTISANDVGTPSINGASAPITVSSASRFTVTAPAAATAGNAFTFTVTARTASGAVDTAYGGSVRFSSSDSSASLPLDAQLANGTGTLTATLRSTGQQTIKRSRPRPARDQRRQRCRRRQPLEQVQLRQGEAAQAQRHRDPPGRRPRARQAGPGR